MTTNWSEGSADRFWSKRQWKLALRYNDIDEHRNRLVDQLRSAAAKEQDEKQEFIHSHAGKRVPTACIPFTGLEISQKLRFWINASSWTFCSRCKLLHTAPIAPQFLKQPATKPAKRCTCLSNRYITPRYSEIPIVLRDLSFAELCVLRPIDLHLGEYNMIKNGYRQKCGMTTASWSKKSVQEKIDALQDIGARQRCRLAYQFLMNSNESSYGVFIAKRETGITQGKWFQLYNSEDSEGIECCFWPTLYPVTSWCETTMKGNESRLSGKISFLTKVMSEIADYGLLYELLQFQYDRWLFKVITGAINTARRTKCSPARALEGKTFSTGFWKWQHLMLVDALRQFGFPSLFITINPYEWTFPLPRWLDNLRNATGFSATKLPAFETLHIAHVLEQLVRGYLCGSNSNRWKQHLFNYNHISGYSNVQTYFYRFEFQERGTVHLHLLVWLKDIKRISTQLVRADIPWQNPDMAYLVHKMQPSDKGCLPQNDNHTQFVQVNDRTILQFYHPSEEFALNLRAYITTIFPTLRCRMDIQSTDGKAMVLRYATSYVSKWQDAYSNEALYSLHVPPYQAAYRHLREMHPLEPEMWLTLSSIKVAWSSSRTKKFVVPTSKFANSNSVYIKYKQRPATMENLSLLQWLRIVNEKPRTPTQYKHGSTLVGLKLVSPFNDEFFFQDLVANLCHRSTTELFHPHIDDIPQQIRFFASATAKLPKVWTDQDTVRARFEGEGHKQIFVETVLSYISSLHDVYRLWQLKVLTNEALSGPLSTSNNLFPIHGKQISIFEHVKAALAYRDNFYNISNNMHEHDSEEEDIDEDSEMQPVQEEAVHMLNMPNIDWHKFFLVVGKPGTGKTQVLLACIQHCLEHQRKVLIATPTGFLANRYKAHFQDDRNVICDTVHSAFQVPIAIEEQPSVNWAIANYDLMVLDEISMIPQGIFRHIITTIQDVPVRPVVILSGDDHQQQPIKTVSNRTVSAPSILEDRHFYTMTQTYHLTVQHRCQDSEYAAFLDHIRHWIPTQEMLNDIQKDKVICHEGQPTDENIFQAIKNEPTATVLTVSRRGCLRINQTIIPQLFSGEEPLAVLQCDCDMEPTPLYKDMRIMITQNRDKPNGVVNGQQATIHRIENHTVLVKLPTGRIVNTYPVTFMNSDNQRMTAYPFAPSYAITICKAQGQTLSKAIIWFDVDTVPAASAYVALSRVKRLQDLILLTPMLVHHFQPVTWAI